MDLSQSDVAEVLGVTPITVSRWETGTQAPDDLTKRMIASVLKTTVAYLFGETVDGESMEEANIPDGSIAVDTVECGYTGGVGKEKTPDFSGVCKTFRHLPV